MLSCVVLLQLSLSTMDSSPLLPYSLPYSIQGFLESGEPSPPPCPWPSMVLP
jgi:hypothetical protein